MTIGSIRSFNEVVHHCKVPLPIGHMVCCQCAGLREEIVKKAKECVVISCFLNILARIATLQMPLQAWEKEYRCAMGFFSVFCVFLQVAEKALKIEEKRKTI